MARMKAALTWLGHATVKLTLADGRVILIDPWLADNPACPKPLKTPPRCDLILLTHGHSDHVGDVPALVAAHDPVIVGNYDLCNVLRRRIGRGRFQGMNTGGTQIIDGVRVSLTQAFHSSSVDTPDGPVYAGMPNGLIVSVGGLATLYHAGDTDVFGDMRLIAQRYQPKVCLLPIGDFYTMGAQGAALAAEMLDPVSIVPVHYKTFPVLAPSADAFRAALSERLRPRLRVAEAGEDVPWTSSGLA
jgi:L-ascorbate metabolism protein UlaG (beta-lactamase superfamily)